MSVRIAYVLTATVGGIGRHVGSLAPRVAAAGHHVVVYCPKATAAAQGFAARGIEVRPLAALATARADLWHAHGLKAGAVALPSSRVRRGPLVVSWHNALLPGAPLRARLLQRLVARSADLTLAASTDLAAAARSSGARRVRLGPVAAPAMSAPLVGRAAMRGQLGVTDRQTVALTVGRLAPQKNLGMLLDVAARFRDRDDLVFLVAGEGPERAALASRIAVEKLPVRLLGARSDVADLTAAADVAMLTSTWEARALVAQEALLAGLPLISTDVGGIRELVGDAAILVGAGDVSAAAEAVDSLAADPGLRLRLAEAGQRQAELWPDEDDVAAELISIYTELVPPTG